MSIDKDISKLAFIQLFRLRSLEYSLLYFFIWFGHSSVFKRCNSKPLSQNNESFSHVFLL